MAYEIKIENFEGPLDLLLHLIRKNEMEICDIPIAEITTQYLAAIDVMKNLNLDVAGEFLLMASTLLYIKSRMLLPPSEEEAGEEEEEDPRAELVRRLLEYQKYKDAAATLETFPLLDRDIFARTFMPAEFDEGDEEAFHSVGLFELVEALRGVLQEAPAPSVHEIDQERLSVTDRINGILTILSGRESLAFSELFPAPPLRQDVVVTFLAMLELVKLRLLRLMQNGRYGTIWLYPAGSDEDPSTLTFKDESLGYC